MVNRSRRALPAFWSAWLLLLLLSASASANPQVPQGGSATFSATGGSGYPGATWTWEVLSPSGTQIATNTSPNGWSVSYSSTFTVGVPTAAAIATNYDVQYNTGNGGPSAAFDVTAAGGTGLSGLTLAPTSVVGGNTNGTQSQGTVTLSSATPADVTVYLTSSNTGVATVPGTATVQAGTTSTTFTVNTSAVTATTSVTISATYSGTTMPATLTVQPWLLSFAATTPVIGGNPSTGTIALNAPAPAGGLTIALSSDNTAVATVAASTVIAAGSSTGTFPISTSPVTSASSANITVTYGGEPLAQSVSVLPLLSSLTLNPMSVAGGSPSTGTITLNAAAPAGGTAVAVSSANSAATVPATVTVPSGTTSATFSVATAPVTTVTTGNITASYGGVSQSVSLTVNPISFSVSLSPASVIGGYPSTGTVTLSGSAPTGGITVTLSSSNTAAVTVPASVNVAAGATTATFTATSTAVSASTSSTITAAYGGLSSQAGLTVQPWLSSLSVSGYQIPSGTTATGTVTLNAAAPAGGIVVSLASTNSVAASVPASVPVPAGSTSATFLVRGGSVSSSTQVTLTASFAGASASAYVTVVPLLSYVSMNPGSIYGGGISTGTVTLSAPAPAGGITVTLSSTSASAAVPASVAVAAGATSATFTATTKAVSASTTATLTAAYGGMRVQTTLTVVPLLASVTFNPSTIAGGSTSLGTVALNAAAPARGLTVALSSGNTAAVKVPTSVAVAAGATTATFTATGAAVTASRSAIITAAYGGATQQGTLNVVPLLSSLSLSPAIAVGPDPSTATVYFSVPAPSGVTVTLTSSNRAVASVPATLAVAAGSYSAQFTVTTGAVSSATSVTISVSYGGVTKQATLTVKPMPTVLSLVLSPNEIVYSPTSSPDNPPLSATGPSASGTVFLTAPAPAAGVTVTLTSSRTGLATVPASVQVPPGSSQATFTVTIPAAVAVTATSTITAGYHSTSKTAVLTVDRPSLVGLSFSPNTLGGGSGTTGTLTLNGPAPAGGLVVRLSCVPANGASYPASVTIPAGSMTYPFSATTSTVNDQVTMTFSAANSAFPADPPAVASLNVLVATLHTVDLFMPKILRLQWYLSSVGNFLLTRDSGDGTGPQPLTSTLANTATSYDDVFNWNSGQTYRYDLYDNNNPAAPFLLSTECVVPYLVTAAKDQAVDSRTDPRYAAGQLLDHNFGSSAYKGGLFAGYDSDPSRIGRSFAQFNLNAYPPNAVFRTGKVNAYFLTGENKHGPVSLQVGCQNVGAGLWDPSTLTWDTALAAFPAFNPAAATQTMTFAYDPSVPWAVTAVPGSGQVTLSWHPPLVGTAVGYTVNYGTYSGYYGSQVTGLTTTSTVITGLTNGTTYYFAVAPVDASGTTGANSPEVSIVPPSAPTAVTPPIINYWASWPLKADILSALTGTNHLLNVGWGGMNEANQGWAYFAKAEYHQGVYAPSTMHAWSLPTLVNLQVPATVALNGQASTSATAIVTVNAIGLTGSAVVSLSATDSGGRATSLISVPPSLTVTGLTRTFPVTITRGAAGQSFIITATYGKTPPRTATMAVTP